MRLACEIRIIVHHISYNQHIAASKSFIRLFFCWQESFLVLSRSYASCFIGFVWCRAQCSTTLQIIIQKIVLAISFCCCTVNSFCFPVSFWTFFICIFRGRHVWASVYTTYTCQRIFFLLDELLSTRTNVDHNDIIDRMIAWVKNGSPPATTTTTTITRRKN